MILLAILPLNLYAGEKNIAFLQSAGYKANMIITAVSVKPTFSNGALSYLVGGFIAVLLMAYLVYTLLRPEKF